MQCFLLPSSIHSQLDQINKNFLWGSYDDTNHGQLLKWDLVVQPKAYGGLGTSKARIKNQTLLVKLGWRLIQEKATPWAKILISKCITDPSNPNLVRNTPF